MAADPRLQAVSFTGGTDGSNPAPSSGESGANSTFEKLARALNVDIKRIKTKRTLLDRVCPEVAEMLKDKSLDTEVFSLLRKMKPLRQIEAVELMSAMNNFTARYMPRRCWRRHGGRISPNRIARRRSAV